MSKNVQNILDMKFGLPFFLNLNLPKFDYFDKQYQKQLELSRVKLIIEQITPRFTEMLQMINSKNMSIITQHEVQMLIYEVKVLRCFIANLTHFVSNNMPTDKMTNEQCLTQRKLVEMSTELKQNFEAKGFEVSTKWLKPKVKRLFDIKDTKNPFM